MLYKSQQYAKLFERELLLVEHIFSIRAEVEHLVSNLSLLLVGQVEEDIDEITVDEVCKAIKVNQALDVTPPEKLVVTPRFAITIIVASNRCKLRHEVILLVFAELLL